MTNYIRPHTILQYAKKHPKCTFEDYGRYVASIRGYTFTKSSTEPKVRISFLKQLLAILKHFLNIK